MMKKGKNVNQNRARYTEKTRISVYAKKNPPARGRRRRKFTMNEIFLFFNSQAGNNLFRRGKEIPLRRDVVHGSGIG